MTTRLALAIRPRLGHEKGNEGRGYPGRLFGLMGLCWAARKIVEGGEERGRLGWGLGFSPNLLRKKESLSFFRSFINFKLI
jgi:hypothetical protein